MFKQMLCGLSLFVLANVNANECDCDFLVSGSIDGAALGVQPGDKICLDGTQSYNGGPLRWENIIGTAEEPVIIQNCGGQVHINPDTSAYGWKFLNSKHFKILGDGDPRYEYGIKVTTKTGFFLTMEYFTTDFEIAHVEIAGLGATVADNGFAGIGMKTSPYQDCDLFEDPTKSGFLMDNVSVHDNYIHDLGGEGIYAGHGFYQGRQESRCDEGVITYAHNIHNLSIYDNIITDVGYDGIQVKNADLNARIYNNVVRNYGLEGKGSHDEGIFIGDGFEGWVYSNWIENGPGHGLQVNAFGDTQIFNNVVINSGDDGVYLNNRSASFANRDGSFLIAHNTFVNMGDDAIEAYTPQSITLVNNIFVNWVDKDINGFNSSSTSNLFLANVDQAGFVSVNDNNFGITSQSIALNAAESSSITTDFSGVQRSDGFADIGAFEFGSVSTQPEYVDEGDLGPTSEVEKIELDPNMIEMLSGNGDPALLVDEQQLVGDPLNGESAQPITYWKSTDGRKTLPHSARIDLATDYVITDIYLYDANGHGDIQLQGTSIDGQSWQITDPGTSYNVWRQHSVNAIARYIDVTRFAQNRFHEIVLYGYLRDFVEPEISLNGDDFITIGLGQTYVDAGATAIDNLDGDISNNIIVDNSEVNTDVAGTYTVSYQVADSSGNSASVERKIQVLAPQIILTPEMVTLIEGNGDATALVDEQLSVGSPREGNANDADTFWKTEDGGSSLPHTMRIDLGEEYRISEIYLFDTNGKGDLQVSGFSEGDNATTNWSITDPGSRYNVWVSHELEGSARYIEITRFGQNYFNEIVVYGHPHSAQ
ncbi:DUF5011 domain-containing protein [Alteromonas sp. 5E99-2]|uniref:immunoglobulin-like domain-containing protein n=1 Tax=Alteromonas sp. 5E99-2 TaxID=2817683 RepID=UPI001A9A24CF|nr:immunoglobulin-like domain-containing protein [Alteromonas sp. 5E99-2]MBO1255746.1 DUF5011 domain-containing protein [Alteromonas sp. 5E99-2]